MREESWVGVGEWRWKKGTGKTGGERKLEKERQFEGGRGGSYERDPGWVMFRYKAGRKLQNMP